MTRVVSPDREGAELAEQAYDGLEQLAKGMEDDGDTLFPWQVRQYIRMLSRTPVAPLDLAINIADCLDMLAARWRLIDRPEVADAWFWRARRIRERAMMRAIARTVLSKPGPP